MFRMFSPYPHTTIPYHTVMPTEGPRIFGARSTGKVGDVVSVNCTSTKSKPAAVLKWFVNDNPVDATKVSHEKDKRTFVHDKELSLTNRHLCLNLQIGSDYETILSTQQDNEGLETSSLALKFILTERHFNHGVMRLKCTASIGRSYTMRSEVLVVSGDEEEQESYRLKAIENLSQGKLKLSLIYSRRFSSLFVTRESPLSSCL